MNQQSTSDLPPLPEDTVEGHKKKEKRKEKSSYKTGASPSEPTLPRHVRPEYSTISPTPGPRATSTPAKEPKTQNIPRRGFVTTLNNPSPLPQQVFRQERPLVKIEAKDYHLNFDGEEVEKFIKEVERIAQIEGETDEDLAMQMAFWTTNQKVSDAIEAMPGYEEGNWTQLKKDLITKWGRVEPERRYRKDSLMKLFSETQEDGGIGSLSQYKKVSGRILNYSDIKGAISKDIIKDNFMVSAEDGGYLIPPMWILKNHIEQELEARILVTKRFSLSRDTGRNVTENKNKVHSKEEAFPGMNEAFNKMKEITESLKEQKLETRNQAQGENEDFKKFMTQLEDLKSLPKTQMGEVTYNKLNNQQFKPRNDLPPFSQSHVPYAPAQNIPKPYVKCYYCLEEGHSVSRCNYLFEDQNKKWVRRQGGGFLFTNRQRVPTDGRISPKKLVEEFAKEQEERTKKGKENGAKYIPHQPKEVNITKVKKNDISTAIAKTEDWGSWQSPTISLSNDPFLNNYGLRNTKQTSSRYEHPIQESKRHYQKQWKHHQKYLEPILKMNRVQWKK
ncbi:hypothetical protein O181_092974 [Austropuccinia psidii MF-1]|uniref:Uncharacterized protein n=1 Tax=Austropuccinia psidii MF-1 TaxID=1389203 RepID=A0A9Q3J0B1_9BASI|nr:hypothetical protein [Austropuccinia psidii MF-1]